VRVAGEFRRTEILGRDGRPSAVTRVMSRSIRMSGTTEETESEISRRDSLQGSLKTEEKTFVSVET
jgi:hypothetical protein